MVISIGLLVIIPVFLAPHSCTQPRASTAVEHPPSPPPLVSQNKTLSWPVTFYVHLTPIFEQFAKQSRGGRLNGRGVRRKGKGVLQFCGDFDLLRVVLPLPFRAPHHCCVRGGRQVGGWEMRGRPLNRVPPRPCRPTPMQHRLLRLLYFYNARRFLLSSFCLSIFGRVSSVFMEKLRISHLGVYSALAP